MTLPEAVSNRLIGALFVERGLVSQSQLVVALELQQETGQQLGQILVERFGVERTELAKVVAEHWARMGEAKEDASTRASESWRQLGDILVSRGFVTREQLLQALERQRLTGERLGEALVGQGVISKFELAGSLAEQASLAEAPAETEGEPAPVLHLTRRADAPAAPAAEEADVLVPEPEPVLEAVPDLEPEPDVVAPEPEPELTPALELEPEPELAPEPELRPVVAAEPPIGVEEAPAPEIAASACVAFASTPRGYRLVELGERPVPGVGERIELPDVGELVVLRHGPSPLPADERVCVYLEQPVPVGHAL
ncbi:MAG TPA: hypothetical protein VFI83_06325 [Gaiella sp.]|nr:hypothetical protein [Gaiella sp.]